MFQCYAFLAGGGGGGGGGEASGNVQQGPTTSVSPIHVILVAKEEVGIESMEYGESFFLFVYLVSCYASTVAPCTRHLPIKPTSSHWLLPVPTNWPAEYAHQQQSNKQQHLPHKPQALLMTKFKSTPPVHCTEQEYNVSVPLLAAASGQHCIILPPLVPDQS